MNEFRPCQDSSSVINTEKRRDKKQASSIVKQILVCNFLINTETDSVASKESFYSTHPPTDGYLSPHCDPFLCSGRGIRIEKS